MGLRDWFRRFTSKVKDILGIYNKWDDYKCTALFSDGSWVVFSGKPWGDEFNTFKNLAESYAYCIEMNMTGSFWRFD